MTTKPKLAKKHVDRLVRMMAAHDKREAFLQETDSDVWPASRRAVNNLNAASLRAVLMYLQAVQA